MSKVFGGLEDVSKILIKTASRDYESLALFSCTDLLTCDYIYKKHKIVSGGGLSPVYTRNMEEALSG